VGPFGVGAEVVGVMVGLVVGALVGPHFPRIDEMHSTLKLASVFNGRNSAKP
jgi:hypothetical protein